MIIVDRERSAFVKGGMAVLKIDKAKLTDPQDIASFRDEIKQWSKRCADLAGREKCTVVVDMSKVEYLDSGALTAFILANQPLKPQGHQMVITGAAPHIYSIFAQTRMDEILDVRQETVEQTMATLKSQLTR
ncbi:MAG: STAS domain-containing protein [Pseudomonadota bacterium]|nr:STAS domain-containing protein [Pseudomonadota bacterium]